MDDENLLAYFNAGGDAYSLLSETNPKIEKRFELLCQAIIDLLDEVQKDFPDANYYTASGGFNLLLGSPHNQFELGHDALALSGAGVVVGDGDF